ncbi:MAG: CoA-binding protein, partial [Chloroflexi bacterium]|nr:CoA-binding protein [Chloroflexota bacterium]
MAEEKELLEILTQYKTVAIVGLSPNPERLSYEVAQYLKEQGYCVIPVNPTAAEIMGEISYPNLRSIPKAVEVVDILRRSEEAPAIVEDAIAIGAKVIWMQEGV